MNEVKLHRAFPEEVVVCVFVFFSHGSLVEIFSPDKKKWIRARFAGQTDDEHFFVQLDEDIIQVSYKVYHKILHFSLILCHFSAFTSNR